MKIYGYSKNGKFVNLKEVTLECSCDELKDIANFLSYAEEFHSSDAVNGEYCHSHYRDWSNLQQSLSSDLIIITNIEKCK